VSGRQLLGLLRPFWAPFLLVAALVLVEMGVELTAPKVAGWVVDAALRDGDVALLDRIVALLLGLFAVFGLLNYVHYYCLEATGARLLFRLREDLFARLVRLTPSFYETRRVGELLSRLGSDLTVVQQVLIGQLPGGIQSLLTFAGVLALLLLTHTKLTLLTLAVVPPVVLVAVWYGNRLERLVTQVQDAVADSSAVAEEALSGLRTIQAFTHEPFALERYLGRLRALLRLQFQEARLTGSYMGLLQFLVFAAFGVVLWYGGRLIASKELTPGDLTAFLLYAFSIAVSVASLGGLFGRYRELKGASARLFELLAAEPDIQDAPNAGGLDGTPGRVAFRGVSFRYPLGGRGPALQDIDLVVEPGEVVALVGPSGAGKSTLFSLLLRFYDPTAGRVEVNDRDVRSLRLAELRSVLGLVPQEIFLFAGTVEDNIRLGNPGASDEQVRAAAVAAGADPFIRALPQGYRARVGERGVNLSAGQRQRLAIARAFRKAPAVLLLDEATSALDAESEETVRQALEALLAGRTTLVIAHRLATARRADRILVLDGGRIVASGTHDSLHASNDLYRRYWELQSLPGPLRDQESGVRGQSGGPLH
jgi:subfamily B ATP-binding cassette protein MsbA